MQEQLDFKAAQDQPQEVEPRDHNEILADHDVAIANLLQRVSALEAKVK